ncbi:MAG: phage tail assembly protein [Comamonas sp.]|uniref:phage tail assembly protein n=1 Tax=Comamonas jiangduensis TaxID=1194168 RepID=UPI001B4A6161|nr:phage tail assembly protein [Comamonas jiangduensis]MBP9942413.1 phage tail assembly protein [Comamonas sp.]
MNEAQEIMGALTHTLAKPIKAHSEQVTELQLRRPTPAEAKKIGRMPYVITNLATGAYSPDLSVVGDYISVCAGIPPSSVDQLDLSDLNQLAWQICSFFTTPESSASSS